MDDGSEESSKGIGVISLDFRFEFDIFQVMEKSG
jgi:hypothetical protein